VSLQKMTSDKFAAAQLYGKHANIVDELSAKDISDTGHFKIATGGGSIAGEYKFGNQFQFRNFSKLTFACNRIPDVKDFDDEAYFNRWMVVRFERTIEKKIPNFIASLTTEAERSGMFNLAMGGLGRLLENGKFSYGKTATETKTDMMRGGSSIAQFVVDECELEQGAEISKEAMYDAYVAYCTTNGFGTETIKMFGSKFPFYASYASEGLMNDHDGRGRITRVKAWRNVKIKTPAAPPVVEETQADDLEKLAAEMSSTTP
jgi:putative DNA primase/helicase